MSAQDIIYAHFISKLGEPTCSTSLNDYLEFVHRDFIIENCYSENHHILPKSSFKEFQHEAWNIVKLPYDHHVTAHMLLAKAYPIGSFIHPLNFMLNREDKRQEEFLVLLSKRMGTISKNYWNSLSDNEYKAICAQRRERMVKGQAKVMSDRFYSKHDALDRRRKDSLRFWNQATPEQKAYHAKRTAEGRSHVNQSKVSKSVWDGKSYEDRMRFRSKMATINKDESKRKDAGQKIKVKWQDPLYREKMKSRGGGRKKRSVTIDGVVYKSISEAVQLTGFSLHKVRSYLK